MCLSLCLQAWAVETGKYQDGVDEPDPAKWKANLRCALNKSREFQLKYDGTKETPVQPYKVYEVCDQGGNADAADDDDEEMPNLMELSLNPRPSDPPLFSCVPHADVRPFRLSSDGTFSPVTPGLPMTPDVQVQCKGGCGQSFVSLPPPAESAPPCPAPMEASSIHDVHNQTHCKYDLLSSVPLTDLELKFQYRGRPMGSLTVSNPQGCRLFFGLLEPTPDQVDLLGPVSLQQVRFPGTGELQSHKQKFYTDALLDAMERGLILELWQQDLYAVRLCQCKVFWSGPGVPPHAGPNPLEREKKIKVFSLNDFLQGDQSQSPNHLHTAAHNQPLHINITKCQL
ncbi:interferon regulatory factor 5-like [Etheostoma cragini]|uniref:interferon regulatory factor 5-like n=1 Tax=Etheostoma cragini TaxID=417921 RepID=UPI00155E2287|nr:interferon regulatory factor 5-like [Etheostoma cragini]